MMQGDNGNIKEVLVIDYLSIYMIYHCIVVLAFMMKWHYITMYERFIVELKSHMKAIRILSKGYLSISLIPPSKLEAILLQVKTALTKTNKDYDLVLSRLYLYYNMKLVMFGIDKQKNLIIQFFMFVQPYTDKINFIPNRNCALANSRCQ